MDSTIQSACFYILKPSQTQLFLKIKLIRFLNKK